MKYKKLNLTGFTLVELLVSSVLITIVGTMILSIFVITLRSSAKINNLQFVRENGNYAVSQMTKMLQFASVFNGVSNDGINFFTSCQSPTSGALTQYKHVRMTSFDNGVTTFSCSESPETIASNSASLIDDVNFAASQCYFTCTRVDPTSSPTIGISFILTKKNIVNILDDPAPMEFQTSVTFRNNN